MLPKLAIKLSNFDVHRDPGYLNMRNEPKRMLLGLCRGTNVDVALTETFDSIASKKSLLFLKCLDMKSTAYI